VINYLDQWVMGKRMILMKVVDFQKTRGSRAMLTSKTRVFAKNLV
jgi:hypothetical protein